MSAAALQAFAQEKAPVKNHAVLLASFAALLIASAGIAVWAGQGILGISYLDAYRDTAHTGFDFNNIASGRIHTLQWIAFNFYEMTAFAGIPLALLAAHQIKTQVSTAKKRDWKRLNPWTLAALAFLLALNLSGKVCYESSRLAWFAFPLFGLIAAPSLPPPGRRLSIPALLLALQAASTLVFRMIY
jgi:hypothetical protein